MDDFFVRALVAGVGIALIAGPLGCVLVWRRQAFFGAALAHSALLGVALGLLLDIHLTLGVFVTCVALAVARQRGLLLAGVVISHGPEPICEADAANLAELRGELGASLLGEIPCLGPDDAAEGHLDLDRLAD